MGSAANSFGELEALCLRSAIRTESGLATRVMCHSENGLWELAEVDLDKIKPQAPSGASGGVEFEAIGYLVSRGRLDQDRSLYLIVFLQFRHRIFNF
jgi:hypothetical protein